MDKFEGCPGSRMMDFKKTDEANTGPEVGKINSQLTQWPIQMHLINPIAPYYQGADVLLTADCVAYALGDFHRDYLKDKSIAIACPKLDQGQDVYLEKIKAWIDEAKINTLTVLIMQVPCCKLFLLSWVNSRLDPICSNHSSRFDPMPIFYHFQHSCKHEVLLTNFIA